MPIISQLKKHKRQNKKQEKTVIKNIKVQAFPFFQKEKKANKKSPILNSSKKKQLKTLQVKIIRTKAQLNAFPYDQNRQHIHSSL